MIKTFIATAVAALCITGAASAASVTSELRLSDLGAQARGASEFVLQYNDNYTGFVNYGLEVAAKQNENHGSETSQVSGKLGPALPAVSGFKPTAYVEYGQQFKTGQTADFWGFGGTVSHRVSEGVTVAGVTTGPITADVGFRHREGFKTLTMDETRVETGLATPFGKNGTLYVNYYDTTGTSRYNTLAVGYTRRF